MNILKITAVLLIVAGVLGLAYGRFSYSKETAAAKIGPLELSVHEQKRVDLPMWASIGFILLGGGLLVFGRTKP